MMVGVPSESANHRNVAAMVFYKQDTRLDFAIAGPSEGKSESESEG